jgi:hypothetical protein
VFLVHGGVGGVIGVDFSGSLALLWCCREPAPELTAVDKDAIAKMQAMGFGTPRSRANTEQADPAADGDSPVDAGQTPPTLATHTALATATAAATASPPLQQQPGMAVAAAGGGGEGAGGAVSESASLRQRQRTVSISGGTVGGGGSGGVGASRASAGKATTAEFGQGVATLTPPPTSWAMSIMIWGIVLALVGLLYRKWTK